MASRRPNPRGAGKPPVGAVLDFSHPLANGLVACWNFAAGSGLREPEAAGSGADATLASVQTYSTFGALSGLRQPGAVGVAATAPDRLAVFNPPLLSAFVLVTFNTFNGASNNHIFNRTTAGGSGFRVFLNPNGPNLKGYVSGGVTLTATTSPSNITTKQTYHFGMTWNGAVLQTYINGVANVSVSGAAVLNTSGAAPAFMNLGSTISAASSCDGWLHQALFYNRALTADEVARLAREPFDMFLAERQQAPAVTSLMASPWPKRLLLPDRPPPYPLL